MGITVRLWRHYHRSARELTAVLEAAGYAPLTVRLTVGRSPDGEFLLLAGRAA